MQGKRVEPIDGDLFLKAGEYGINPKDGKWYARPPDPDVGMGNLSGHDVTEHEDGTITVSPSILISMPDGRELWHGYLERGIWREV